MSETGYPGGSLRAAKRLVQSETLRPFFVWLLGLVLAGVGGSFGWIAHLMTDTSRNAAIEKKVDAVAKKQDELLAMLQRELLSPSEETPGKVVKLERDQRVVWKELVRTRAMAVATESQRTRDAKRHAALDLVESYENLLKNERATRGDPIAAYSQAFEKVAIR